MRVIVIGTRGSLLALAQTRWVVERLKENWPEVEFRTKTITNRSEDPAAGLQDALREREIDIALHALRDLPPSQADGLHLTAVTRRVDPREAFVGRTAKRLEDLPKGAVWGLLRCAARPSFWPTAQTWWCARSKATWTTSSRLWAPASTTP